MIVSNESLHRVTGGAVAGYSYLAITVDKALYQINQVGARSWDAVLIGNMYNKYVTQSINSNRKDILDEVRNTVNVDYIVECGTDAVLRKAIMGHLFGGDMMKDFEIERSEY